jgi:hypothetical protein
MMTGPILIGVLERYFPLAARQGSGANERAGSHGIDINNICKIVDNFARRIHN